MNGLAATILPAMIPSLPLLPGRSIVVTIHDERQRPLLTAVCQALAATTAAPVVVLALDRPVASALAQEGASSLFIEDLVSFDDYRGVSDRATRLARTWHALEPDDPTVLAGVRLGHLSVWEFTFFFAEVLRCLANARRILSDLSPQCIFALEPAGPLDLDQIRVGRGEDFHTDAIEVLGAGAGTPVYRVALTGDQTAAPIARRPGAAARLAHLIGGARPLTAPAGRSDGTAVIALHDHDLGAGLSHWLAGPANRRLVLIAQKPDAPMPAHATCRTLDQCETLESALARGQATVELQRRWTRHRAHLLRHLAEDEPALAATKCVAQRLERWFLRRGPRLFSQIYQSRALLRQERAGVVLLHNDVVELTRTLCTAARSLGIPTLVLQHGAMVNEAGFLPVAANRIAVYGAANRAWLVARGAPSDHAVVTGPSRFPSPDDRPTPQAAGALRQRLGIAPDCQVVVFVHQHCNRTQRLPDRHWPEPVWRIQLAATIVALRGIGGVHLVLKLHPSALDTGSLIDWFTTEANGIPASVTQHERIGDLLGISDVVLTAWSTTAFEAAALSVPLLILAFGPWELPIDFAASGIGERVASADDLGPALRRVLRDEDWRRALIARATAALPDHVACIGADAVQRMITLIEDGVVPRPHPFRADASGSRHAGSDAAAVVRSVGSSNNLAARLRPRSPR